MVTPWRDVGPPVVPISSYWHKSSYSVVWLAGEPEGPVHRTVAKYQINGDWAWLKRKINTARVWKFTLCYVTWHVTWRDMSRDRINPFAQWWIYQITSSSEVGRLAVDEWAAKFGTESRRLAWVDALLRMALPLRSTNVTATALTIMSFLSDRL